MMMLPNFRNVDQFVDQVNKMKIDRWNLDAIAAPKLPATGDEETDNAREFTRLYLAMKGWDVTVGDAGVNVGGVE
jgi:hypothetical protein